MSNIAIFKPNQTPQYLTSVNGAEYMVDPTALEGNVVSNDPDVIFNPDISAVVNVSLKYWKRSGDNIVEMTVGEKQVIDDAELQARKDAANDFSIEGMKIVLTALIKVINLRLPIDKKITKQEMVDALKGEII